MRITVTSTSQTLQDMLSTDDYNSLRETYDDFLDRNQVVNMMVQNLGSNDVFIETNKVAVLNGSYKLTAGNEKEFTAEKPFNYQFIASADSECDIIIT